jgi:hypothetical protein
MGIKERERRVEVFFYGQFMDEELQREPEGSEIAASVNDQRSFSPAGI